MSETNKDKMKTIKELAQNKVHYATGYNDCKKDILKLIDDMYNELENDDKIWCRHIKIIQNKLKARIKG